MRIPRNAAQLAQRERPGDEHEGQETQEDRPPPDVIGDKCGKRRTHDAGHDPGRREDREHARPESVRIRTADDDVRDGGYGAGPKPLDGTCPDEDRHRRCEPSDQQADREQPETGAILLNQSRINHLTGPQFLTTASANATANLVRNLWAYSIIFCGHFPSGVATFTEEETENETRGEAAPPFVQ